MKIPQASSALTFTFVALGVPGHLDGVVSREDPPSASPHVVALVPVILWLDLHQQGVVHLQLQLVVVARDEPAKQQGCWCSAHIFPCIPSGQWAGLYRTGSHMESLDTHGL